VSSLWSLPLNDSFHLHNSPSADLITSEDCSDLATCTKHGLEQEEVTSKGRLLAATPPGSATPWKPAHGTEDAAMRPEDIHSDAADAEIDSNEAFTDDDSHTSRRMQQVGSLSHHS
jgi:hypothetical protein